ncbi:TadE/TadG family type IV pilus assembly protein [Magnetospira sp. QH-2]|uniref:TadE/TadG family type IV pilus assembly protein n=1 Tax=Magnetospira sp. (strain QH-2) TaxID=1288970 RepID=UPI0003E819BC|nr:TadE/TadG family type IV pilus assembly protein [Magnetospira sp. QH-2]CCQ73543.1 Protein of unknown function [Magnetospira sp. QH-2]
MSKSMWATKLRGTGRRLGRCERGESLIAFGFLLPVIIAFSFGILEFSLLVFDYHRVNEGLRLGARLATVGDSVTDLSGLATGASVTCESSGGAVSCSAGTADANRFNAILSEVRRIQPYVQSDHLKITYSDVGLGHADEPGGLIPLVTLRIEGLSRDFIILDGVPGIPATYTYPPFTTSLVANGQGPA